MPRSLLLVSAAAEVGAGVALLLVPGSIVGILVGGTLDSPTALAVARLAGAALATLGLICGFASRESRSRTAAGVIAGLLFYNVVAVAILLYARLGTELAGLGLWPAIALHGVLSIWCFACVRRRHA